MCKNEAQSCSCSFTITQSWLAVCRSAPVLHAPQQFFDLFMRKSRFLIDDRGKRGAGVQVNATKQRRRCVPVCINKWPHRNKQQWWFSHRLRGHFYPHCFCTKPNIHIKQMTQVLTKFLLRGAWQPDIPGKTWWLWHKPFSSLRDELFGTSEREMQEPVLLFGLLRLYEYSEGLGN